jgi:hypothetical protein
MPVIARPPNSKTSAVKAESNSTVVVVINPSIFMDKDEFDGRRSA